MEVILAERKRTGNTNKSFGINNHISTLEGESYPAKPIEKIKLKKNVLLEDFKKFLFFINKKKGSILKLTPKRKEIVMKDIDKLDDLERSSIIEYKTKNKNIYRYSIRIYGVFDCFS